MNFVTQYGRVGQGRVTIIIYVCTYRFCTILAQGVRRATTTLAGQHLARGGPAFGCGSRVTPSYWRGVADLQHSAPLRLRHGRSLGPSREDATSAAAARRHPSESPRQLMGPSLL